MTTNMFDYTFSWDDAVEKLAAKRGSTNRPRRNFGQKMNHKDALLLKHISNNPTLDYKNPMHGYSGIDLDKLKAAKTRRNMRNAGIAAAGLSIGAGTKVGIYKYLENMRRRRNMRNAGIAAAALGAAGLGTALANKYGD